ncbi:hypothetical protein GGF46_003495 [Coemansia sp. RSA 552]|nr:hypothetical protein GGF46_003495 [Coemansia sp. RSA 552]
MRLTKSQGTLLKPFKSPARAPAASDPGNTASLATTPTKKRKARTDAQLTTPTKKRQARADDQLTAPIQKRQARTDDQLTTPTRPPHKRAVPGSAPVPGSKRTRATPLSLVKQRYQRRQTVGGLPLARDPELLRLQQERAGLQRQLALAREEAVLVERAVGLKDKDDAGEVGALVVKWKAACSAASEDLFELLRPMMESARDAEKAGTSDEAIDVARMLRLFGIEADLF